MLITRLVISDQLVGDIDASAVRILVKQSCHVVAVDQGLPVNFSSLPCSSALSVACRHEFKGCSSCHIACLWLVHHLRLHTAQCSRLSKCWHCAFSGSRLRKLVLTFFMLQLMLNKPVVTYWRYGLVGCCWPPAADCCGLWCLWVSSTQRVVIHV